MWWKSLSLLLLRRQRHDWHVCVQFSRCLARLSCHASSCGRFQQSLLCMLCTKPAVNALLQRSSWLDRISVIISENCYSFMNLLVLSVVGHINGIGDLPRQAPRKPRPLIRLSSHGFALGRAAFYADFGLDYALCKGFLRRSGISSAGTCIDYGKPEINENAQWISTYQD